MVNYGIKYWADNNFTIEDGKLKINEGSKPSLIEIVQKVRDDGYKGPLMLRFPHLIRKQIDILYNNFQRAIEEFEYIGTFNAVFPLKVNQFPNFVKSLTQISKEYNYGLEAGSKAELILAMSYTNLNSPITVNGFKDRALISMGFIASKMGHNITLTIEGLNELETILEVAKEFQEPYPKIGLRIRLHSSGSGVWAKSGGIDSKFGLTSTELIEALELIQEANLIDRVQMVHFHIGSQIDDISPLKKALREAGNIYAELKKLGAKELNSLNLGGGLAVEYSQNEDLSRNYSIKEFANDVVFSLKEIMKSRGVEEPNIYTESGRFISATHSLLVAPVLELFSKEYELKSLKLKESENPPIVDELNDLYQSINSDNALEYLHDSLDHLESILTLFELGYVDLIDRSNTEILVHLIIKKATKYLKSKPYRELKRVQSRVQEKYLVNFSLFQSLPDYWGLGQKFPVMPLDRLDEEPTRSASIWDITCDSDGEIGFNSEQPLFLHDVDIESEEYFLAFFLLGAYQEVLGMKHNLFTHPTEVTVKITDKGYELSNIIEAQNILDVLDDLDYDIKDIERILKQRIDESNLIDEKAKKELLGELYLYLSDNGYLRTLFSNKK